MAEVIAFLSVQRWAFQTVAMTLTAVLIPGFKVTSVFGPILAVVALAFINAHVWSTALFFQVPDTFTTQAGLLFAVNGAIFWVLVKLLPGVEVKGLLPALAAPVVFTVLSVLVENYGNEVNWGEVFEETYAFLISIRDYFLAANEGVASS